MDWLDHDRLGFNYRLSDIAAAVGVEQVRRLDELLAARQKAAELYSDALRGLDVMRPAPGDRSWFVYVVQLPASVDRDQTIIELQQQGIESKPYLPAIHLMSFYKEKFGWKEGDFPVCEDVARRSLALPFFSGITESQIEQVAGALRELLPSDS